MTHNPSNGDSTIRDIHAIREQISDKFDGDMAAILEDARQRQQASGRRILQRGELSNKAAPTRWVASVAASATEVATATRGWSI